MTIPLVSVVISTKNEEKNIENCLNSIVFQTYPKENIEIIVVDNSSTDRTKEISQKYTDKVFNKGPERSTQRNFGMLEKSTGQYLMFLDADMILSPNVVEESVKKMESEEGLVGVYISEVVLGKSYFSKVRRFERSFYDGTVIDGARFIKKSVFEKVGGFDEDLYAAEDWDLDKRLKKIGNLEVLENKESVDLSKWEFRNFILERGVNPENFGSVIYHNESEFDLKIYLSKKKYYSKNFNKYLDKWGREDSDIKKQFGFWYRFFGVYIENGKWRKLVSNLHLVFGMYFLRFLVGLSFVLKAKNENICKHTFFKDRRSC